MSVGLDLINKTFQPDQVSGGIVANTTTDPVDYMSATGSPPPAITSFKITNVEIVAGKTTITGTVSFTIGPVTTSQQVSGTLIANSTDSFLVDIAPITIGSTSFSSILVTNNPTDQPPTLGVTSVPNVSENIIYDPNAPCFVSGTLIRTLRGDIAVEHLQAGDVAVTVTGACRPIAWVGHRTVDCREHPNAVSALPVRVAAHAFGIELPERDLYLSPGHPVLVGADDDGAGGHLVPIMCLINGTTIERTKVDSVTYWHVELDEHDILLAEGLPAESYLDWGDRPFFKESSDHALHNPDFVVPGLAARCRPVAIDGPIVEGERRRLDRVFAARLAAASAWPSMEADRLIVA